MQILAPLHSKTLSFGWHSRDMTGMSVKIRYVGAYRVAI